MLVPACLLAALAPEENQNQGTVSSLRGEAHPVIVCYRSVAARTLLASSPRSLHFLFP